MRVYPFQYPLREVIYKTVERSQLKLYIFEPEMACANRTAILFFIGGSFGKGPRTPADFQHQAKYISSKGAIAICVDCRTGHDEGFTPIQAICDVKSAVRYVREHAAGEHALCLHGKQENKFFHETLRDMEQYLISKNFL